MRDYSIVCSSGPKRKSRNEVALIFNLLTMKLARQRFQTYRVLLAWLESSKNSETIKIVVSYSPTNPNDEKVENGLIASTLISSE